MECITAIDCQLRYSIWMDDMSKPRSFTKTTTQDYNQDGVADYTTVEWENYNRKGLLTDKGYWSDWSGDGVADFTQTTTNTFDRHGNVTRSVELQEYADPVLSDNIVTTDNTYKNGNLVKSEAFYDYGIDGSTDSIYTITSEFNKRDQVTSILNEWDWNGDSIVDSADSVQYEYDGKDLVAENHDWGNDSIIDQVITYDYA